MTTQPNIDDFSFVPLHLETKFQETKLKDATGFVVQHGGNYYLITNWHVVTGRNPQTNQPTDEITSSIPNNIAVWFHAKEHRTGWYKYDFPLIDEKEQLVKNLWIEHPQGEQVDVVAILLPQDLPDVKYYPLDLSLAEVRLNVSPVEDVSIVGFPFGKQSFGEFPIWKAGHVASDVDLSFDKKPIFLIDATAKSGMSGHPL